VHPDEDFTRVEPVGGERRHAAGHPPILILVNQEGFERGIVHGGSSRICGAHGRRRFAVDYSQIAAPFFS
jgi:hypothetical protein